MTNISSSPQATLLKKSFINTVRWMVFIGSTLAGLHCGFIEGGVGGAIIGTIVGALYGLVIMVWLSCLK